MRSLKNMCIAINREMYVYVYVYIELDLVNNCDGRLLRP